MEERRERREKGIHREKLWHQDIGIDREEERCDGKNKD
jgi:hypothetical protein